MVEAFAGDGDFDVGAALMGTAGEGRGTVDEAEEDVTAALLAAALARSTDGCTGPAVSGGAG